jgi:hypothetical protein
MFPSRNFWLCYGVDAHSSYTTNPATPWLVVFHNGGRGFCTIDYRDVARNYPLDISHFEQHGVLIALLRADGWPLHSNTKNIHPKDVAYE